MPPPITLYRYNASPFSVKIDNVLLLKQLSHSRVNVSSVLPRPDITEGLGLPYRRIPVLAIGNDVYCDTSLIISVLERRFPDSKYSLFPPRKSGGGPDKGLLKALSSHYIDRVLFPLAVVLLPWEKFPSSFIKDRETWTGKRIDVQAVISSRQQTLGTISAHLKLAEEQLSDGRDWLFETETPGLVDISLAFVISWIKSMRNTASLFDKSLPHTLQWFERFTEFMAALTAQTAPPEILSGDEAAKQITSAPFEPYSVVGFDQVEASRLGVTYGQVVSVAPDDTGKAFPTIGKLVALDKSEVILETQGKFGMIRCHFPRIGFTCKLVVNSKL